ncbi:hypothetical protein [Candidatus Viadribacter manganicus]|uniref:DUF4190 domain-containing protein n=1 Tax=Candidatus Viadribacter manganicus TaxID=1759059 RepID=A0A1B1AKD7_9PROT|nr:hypothetical protein [Candidatus Viadribacter manganicus]ANP47024.1 hypothetical protein ATE48_14415 [Candidatus Viadribacter manganicus]
MRGTILGVHDNRGVLIGEGELRFDFPLTEWRSGGAPYAGQIVDYVEEDGQARAVFAVPGVGASSFNAPASSSRVLGIIGVICLVLSFVIPLIPTIAAFVLGVIGAGQAQQERDDTSLLLARISWIGAVVMLGFGLLIVLGVLALVGTLGLAGVFHGWENF